MMQVKVGSLLFTDMSNADCHRAVEMTAQQSAGRSTCTQVFKCRSQDVSAWKDQNRSDQRWFGVSPVAAPYKPSRFRDSRTHGDHGFEARFGSQDRRLLKFRELANELPRPPWMC